MYANRSSPDDMDFVLTNLYWIIEETLSVSDGTTSGGAKSQSTAQRP